MKSEAKKVMSKVKRASEKKITLASGHKKRMFELTPKKSYNKNDIMSKKTKIIQKKSDDRKRILAKILKRIAVKKV